MAGVCLSSKVFRARKAGKAWKAGLQTKSWRHFGTGTNDLLASFKRYICSMEERFQAFCDTRVSIGTFLFPSLIGLYDLTAEHDNQKRSLCQLVYER